MSVIDSPSSALGAGSCGYCSSATVFVYHTIALCPNVQAIEYYLTGGIKRVEFRNP